MKIISNMDTESRPIKWLFDEFRKGNLFIDETFQRNYIWIRKDKISLMETIILGYPIPEIYLWETGTDPNSGETKYSIVDGQQRIRTISNFIDGNLKLTDSGLEFQGADYCGKNFDELQPEIRSSIWSYKISIRFIKNNIAREDIVKMFLRLNKTSNGLNPQELRHAEFSGEFVKASEEVASINFWKKHSIFSDGEIRRMLDIQFASTLLIFVRSGFEDETTQSAINKMYDLLNESYPERNKDIEKISRTLNFLEKVIEQNHALAEILKKKTHLYSIFTLCFTVKDRSAISVNDFSNSLESWFSWYEGKDEPESSWKNDISEYKRLSQEGVQKKANRFRRYELLANFVGI